MINQEFFTKDEQAILRSLPSLAEWIARDADGKLYVYDSRPKRREDEFVWRENEFVWRDSSYEDTYFVNITMFKHIFKGVTFENSPIRFRAAVLDDVEKAYLKAVFKPFQKRIVSVVKVKDLGGLQHIEVELSDDDTMSFPFFEAETMYKGMEVDKDYSLDELGIKY